MGNQEKKATKKKFVSQSDTDDQPLLSVKQVAALLNIHPEVVRRHIRSGDLQAVKVGKLFRISRDNVKKWQKDQGKPEETRHRRGHSRAFRSAARARVSYSIPREKRSQFTTESPMMPLKSPNTRDIVEAQGEPYPDLSVLIADFEQQNRNISAKVEAREYPFWEVTVFARTRYGETIRKFIGLPGVVRGTIAKVEDPPLSPDGPVTVDTAFGETRNFRNFVAKVLDRYTSMIPV
jgi:excisionase family DNA binding protein